MKKKFICTVCGYIHEGPEPPEKCPICKVPASKFKELEDDGTMTFATAHILGAARKEGATEEMIKDLKDHFAGECSEVGMYLAMSRQADREGYPEVAEAFKRYAFEEAEHAAKFAELLGDVLSDTKSTSSVSPKTPRPPAWTLLTTPSTRWQRTRPDTAQDSMDSIAGSSSNTLLISK